MLHNPIYQKTTIFYGKVIQQLLELAGYMEVWKPIRIISMAGVLGGHAKSRRVK